MFIWRIWRSDDNGVTWEPVLDPWSKYPMEFTDEEKALDQYESLGRDTMALTPPSWKCPRLYQLGRIDVRIGVYHDRTA